MKKKNFQPQASCDVHSILLLSLSSSTSLLLPQALYKPCATWRGEFEEAVAVFLCNGGEGHRGEYVYIR